MKIRKCSRCGHAISKCNPSSLCFACLEEQAEIVLKDYDRPTITVKEIAVIMDVDDETVRRWVRTKKLPPPLSIGRGQKWGRDYFINWIRSQFQIPPPLGRELESLDNTLGSTHLDEITGKYKRGDKVNIQVTVHSKDKNKEPTREVKKISTVIPKHD